MDNFSFIDDKNPIVVGDEKPRGKKMVKGSNIGSVPRKRLADISNLQQPSKLSNEGAKPQQTDSLAANVYVDQLHKENMTLMKLLAERNKLIELNGIELQKMRINLQKTQQQNLQLAKANNSMLAELNTGKDRLRVLQHELGCINTLHKARNFVLEDKANTLTCHTSGNQIGADKRDKGGKADEQDKKPCNTNRRRQSKNQFLHVASDSSTVNSVQDKEKVDNKRLCLRRQSARFKPEEAEASEERVCLRRQSARFKCEEPAPAPEPEPTQNRRQSARFKSIASKPTEDSFEIGGVKSPVSLLSDKLVHENDPTSSDLSVQQEHKEGNCAQNDEAHETRRRSSERPLRRAVEKVQSYKEITLKVKMRREN